jgi:hypothetical protein
VNGPIKIPHGNFAYVANQTQCASLLTRSRSHSYRKATSPQNLVRDRNHGGSINRCKQNTSKTTTTQNQTTKALTSSQAFRRIPCGHDRETTTKNLENSSLGTGGSRTNRWLQNPQAGTVVDCFHMRTDWYRKLVNCSGAGP